MFLFLMSEQQKQEHIDVLRGAILSDDHPRGLDQLGQRLQELGR